jgi:hypothetical protein
MVPVDKAPLPHHKSAFVGVARTLATWGMLGCLVLFSMVLAEGKVEVSELVTPAELAGLGLVGLLLTWRWVRPGGLAVLGAMIVALMLTPDELLEWRPWFYAVEGYLALCGLLLLLSPRAEQ